MAGRPTTLNDSVISAITKALESGCYLHEAAAAANVAKASVYNWRKQAYIDRKQGKTSAQSIHIRFLEECEVSLSKGRQTLVDRIVEAGKDKRHWQANAWVLERGDPEHWGSNQHMIKEMQLQIRELTAAVKALTEQVSKPE